MWGRVHILCVHYYVYGCNNPYGLRTGKRPRGVTWHFKHNVLHWFGLRIPALEVPEWCISEVIWILGSWEGITVAVTKHVTCTYMVTSAASICMHHEAFVINTFFSYSVHICMHTWTRMHGVQRVEQKMLCKRHAVKESSCTQQRAALLLYTTTCSTAGAGLTWRLCDLPSMFSE